MSLFYYDLCENGVRERAKASDCSQTFLWGKMWGRMSQSVGKENPRALEGRVALTIKEIENAKPKDKKYKLADGGWLCLLIQTWGRNFWLWRYRFDGAEKNLTFGEYRAIALRSSRSPQPKRRRRSRRKLLRSPSLGSCGVVRTGDL